MDEYRLSKYGHAAIVPSPVNRMMASFAHDFRDGIDINLGVGYVNEKTIPDVRLLEAMKEVVARPDYYRQAFNYGGPQGSPNLIRAIKRFLDANKIGQMDQQILSSCDLVVGASGATSILEALADIFEPGIVITADPMYYIYCNFLERKGFRVVTVPEDEEGLSVDLLEEQLQALGEEVATLAFFYIVTVNNPTGVILSNPRKKMLIELALRWSHKVGYKIPIFFDQAYEWLIHDPEVEKPVSGLRMDTRGLVYEVGTLSKIIAPALRIGFILGPPGPIMGSIVQKTSDVGFSAPLLTQEMAACFLENYITEQLYFVNSGYRAKALQVHSAIVSILGPWLEDVRGGKAGFYFYITFKTVSTDTHSPFFKFLSRTTGDNTIDRTGDRLNPRVVYLPGEFCVHPHGKSASEAKRQLRLSYGYENTEAIIRALEWMRQALEYCSAG